MEKNRRGRPSKSETTLHKAKRNVRLLLGMDQRLQRISDHTGIPLETLLRSYANEGIRKDEMRLFGNDDDRLIA